MLADSLSGKVSLPGLQTAILSLCSHGRVSELCGISSYKNMNPVRSGHYSDDLMQLSYFHKMLSLKVKVSQLCLTLWPLTVAVRLLCPWNSPGKNTGVGSCLLLQGIFQIQGSNTGLLHCRWTLYCLSHQRSPRILKPENTVVYPFSRGSSWPRDPTGNFWIAGGLFTSWAPREAPIPGKLSSQGRGG